MPVGEALTKLWEDRWPTCRPIGHELRACAPDRWVRFHSFSAAQRHPQTDDDLTSLLHRHNTVLTDVAIGGESASASSSRLVILTCSWSGGPEPSSRDQELCGRLPAAEYWRSISMGEPGFDSWIHLWVSDTPWASGAIDPLLELVATDGTDGVIVTDEELSWLYHPYDGGADVIARSVRERVRLAARHADWLSPRLDGL